MDITVHIASRGRPLSLVAALLSLQQAESGKHNVRYGVAVDVDDPKTIEMCQAMQPKWRAGSGFRVGHRPASIDGLHNQIALDIPGDVYVCFADDMTCATKDWDAKIADLVEANPKGVWFWSSTGTAIEHFTHIPIITEAWRAAAGGIFPEYFPYWWGDTWLAEVWALATETTAPYAPVTFIDFPRATTNMRDLRFWHEFYRWLQPVRIEEAKRIAVALDLPALTITDAFAKFTGAYSREFVDSIDAIEQGQGDRSEPHEGYKVAKARAEEMMRTEARPRPADLALEDLLTPEVVAVLNQYFPDIQPV